MLLIETKDVNKWMWNRQLLNNISESIYQGDKIGFVGRNGTGKSILLKIINSQDKEYQTVGFNDQSYFSKVFKKLTGLLPGSYR